MQIYALVIIAICLIIIAYRDLKIALMSFAGIVLVAILFYFISPSDAPNQQWISSVELKQPSISKGYANGFVLNARMHNKHDSLTFMNISVVSGLADCKQNKTSCLTIGEEMNLIKLRIPPGQARDVSINLGIKQLNPIVGEAVWTHKVVGVQ